jgi:hypothetical protein
MAMMAMTTNNSMRVKALRILCNSGNFTDPLSLSISGRVIKATAFAINLLSVSESGYHIISQFVNGKDGPTDIHWSVFNGGGTTAMYLTVSPAGLAWLRRKA